MRAMAYLHGAVECLKAERDENTQRKPFSKSELGEMSSRLLAIEKPAAKARQEATQRNSSGNSGVGTVPTPEKGRASDKVGEALGVSGKTAERAAAVVQAAKDDPETFGDLPEMMDAEGGESP